MNVSSLGIPKYFDDQRKIKYSQFCAEILIDRHRTHSVMRFFLSISILFLVLYSMFFISVEKIFVRLLFPLSALTANAFYHVKLISALQVEYITVLEYGYFIIYLLSALSMAFILITNKLYKNGHVKAVQILFYIARTIQPSILLILSFRFFFKYLMAM